MSRIGKSPIDIPSGVSVEFKDDILKVKGPKGELTQNTFGKVKMEVNDSKLIVTPKSDDGVYKKFWGLYRTLANNIVIGVTSGFKKSLEVIGTGYRASMQGNTLILNVGYSHQVKIEPPKDTKFEVDKAGKIHVIGISKEVVGQMAAKIRAVRPPEPYQGKDVRYLGEVIVTKAGKSASKGKK